MLEIYGKCWSMVEFVGDCSHLSEIVGICWRLVGSFLKRFRTELGPLSHVNLHHGFDYGSSMLELCWRMSEFVGDCRKL